MDWFSKKDSLDNCSTSHDVTSSAEMYLILEYVKHISWNIFIINKIYFIIWSSLLCQSKYCTAIIRICEIFICIGIWKTLKTLTTLSEIERERKKRRKERVSERHKKREWVRETGRERESVRERERLGERVRERESQKESSGTKLLLPSWLLGFSTREERDTIFTMLTAPYDPTTRGTSRRPNRTGLA